MHPRKNAVVHEIDLVSLSINNAGSDHFQRALAEIRYRGYDVETLEDGQKIVITKPARKFQRAKGGGREDFVVWVFDPSTNELWPISHKEILADLERKGAVNPEATVEIIDALGRVYQGEEPGDILPGLIANPTGEPPELLLKAYKWIWGQEDVNYPPPRFKGRAMSWEAIRELRDRLAGGAPR